MDWPSLGFMAIAHILANIVSLQLWKTIPRLSCMQEEQVSGMSTSYSRPNRGVDKQSDLHLPIEGVFG